MHRFFVPPDWITEQRAIIRGGIVHQVRNVLRLKAGDEIMLLDNSGLEYRVRLENLVKDHAEGSIISKSPGLGEPRVEIVLYQALLKGENFEFLLQKCTEVGVTGFVPLRCERCISSEPGESKLERWRRITREAAEQCGRAKIPFLQPPVLFEEACKSAQGSCLLAWEGERERGLRACLQDLRQEARFSIFVGPEGGFSQREVEFARSQGMTTVGLGRRTLRAETAGLVTAASILYEFGELAEA